MTRNGSAARAWPPAIRALLGRWSGSVRVLCSVAPGQLAAAHLELARRQAFTDALLETIDVGIVSCDAAGVFVVGNQAERRMFGFPTAIDGLAMADLDTRIDVFEDGKRLEPEEYPLMRALRGQDVSAVEVVAGPAGGSLRELVVRGRQILGANGEVLGAVAALTDVTAERSVLRQLADEHRKLAEAEQRLRHIAVHDDLTGLPNRVLLIDRLESALARSAREGGSVAVLFCDLDGFKQVNDTGGHAAGNAVLCEVAGRLAGILRPSDTVARVGGDEFVILVEPWKRAADSERADPPRTGDEAPCTLAVQVADRVVEALRTPVTVCDHSYLVTASVGVASSTEVATDPGAVTAEDMLRHADAAMYVAKGCGKNRLAVSAQTEADLATLRR